MMKTEDLRTQFQLFPGSRYMGSKNKIIHQIWDQIKDLEFESVFDAFGGSNVVGYFLKSQGKRVLTNDFMAFSYITSKAIIENSSVILNDDDVEFLLKANVNENFIQTTFKDIFYSLEDNIFLDHVRKNISSLDNEYKAALALAALVRACAKKRSRGIFTFVGERYDDGRSDMKKSIKQHFIESISLFNQAVFDNESICEAFNTSIDLSDCNADLVYLDPPYYNPKSDNDYVRRYHFLEGLVKNWEGLKIQDGSKVKKFLSYKSPFSKKDSAYEAFENLISKYRDSIIVISYSSNSYPTKEEIITLLENYKKTVTLHEMNHTYSFGNQNHKTGNVNNRVKEYLFIGQ